MRRSCRPLRPVPNPAYFGAESGSTATPNRRRSRGRRLASCLGTPSDQRTEKHVQPDRSGQVCVEHVTVMGFACQNPAGDEIVEMMYRSPVPCTGMPEAERSAAAPAGSRQGQAANESVDDPGSPVSGRAKKTRRGPPTCSCHRAGNRRLQHPPKRRTARGFWQTNLGPRPATGED